jgi:Leucine-rich repeat (LRR) protein
VTRLDLHSSRVAAVHPALGDLVLLQELLLSGNCITSLPCSIGKLSALRVLYVAENKLVTVPETVGQLSALVELDVSGNPLQSLPEGLWGLGVRGGVTGGADEGGVEEKGGSLERVYMSKGLKNGGVVPAVLPGKLQVVWW